MAPDATSPSNTTISRRRPAQRLQSGQSLLEFTVMAIVLAVLLMGVLDLARAYFTYLALKDAAAEGAYFGSAYPQCVDASVVGANPACGGANNIVYRTRNSAPVGGLVDWQTANVQVTLPPALQPGESITVSVAYQYQMLTPIISAIATDQTLTLRAVSAATIIRVPDCTFADVCR
jgi:Flp pilus assembly protein TadG